MRRCGCGHLRALRQRRTLVTVCKAERPAGHPPQRRCSDRMIRTRRTAARARVVDERTTTDHQTVAFAKTSVDPDGRATVNRNAATPHDHRTEGEPTCHRVGPVPHPTKPYAHTSVR